MEDVVQARKERIGELIEQVHSQLQAALVEAGLDSATARTIAGTRVFAVLPKEVKNALTLIETEVSAQFAVIFAEVSTASEADLQTKVWREFGTENFNR